MIAVITITLGWWLVPTTITAGLLIWARDGLSDQICAAILLVPILFAWCGYFALRLLLS